VKARLAAIDLDGTLLRSDKTISERSRAAIAAAAAAGIEIVVVTARSPRSAAGLAADAGIGGIAICANGAIVFDLASRTIARHEPLSAELATRIATGLRGRVPGIAFGWELELRFGSEPAYEASRDPSGRPRPEGSFPPCDVRAWGRPMTKLLARLPGADLTEVLGIASELGGDEVEVTLAGHEFVEVTARGVSKAAALARLAAEREIGAAEVVAFGDHLTDAEMLSWAGLGVAVANAREAVLAAADVVTASNDEDGVALVLERLVLGDAQPIRSASVGA
jgi:hydroxymethylpyrimidine pyrophosphatase-like HAD family hydrolase